MVRHKFVTVLIPVFCVLLLAFPAAAKPGLKTVLNRAVRAWRAGDYNKALDLFTRAHELRPKNLSYVWDMARCNEKLGHLQQALSQYKQVLAMHPPASRVPAIKARIAAVQRRLAAQKPKKPQPAPRAWLLVHAQKDAVVIVDTRRIGQGSGRIPVTPGMHTVMVVKEGFRTCTKQVTAITGKVLNVKCPLIALKAIKHGVWHQPVTKKAVKPESRAVKPVIAVTKPAPRPTRHKWSTLKKALFWSGIGLGIAGLGVNVWAATEGHKISDFYDTSTSYHDRAKKGIYASVGLYAAGAALVITALVLPEKKHAHAISIVPVSHGVMAGYVTQF